MTNSEYREPTDSESTVTSEAGEEQSQTEQVMASRELGATTDYESREENISEQRKPMGPPLKLKKGKSMMADAREDLDDEEPVDPA